MSCRPQLPSPVRQPENNYILDGCANNSHHIRVQIQANHFYDRKKRHPPKNKTQHTPIYQHTQSNSDDILSAIRRLNYAHISEHLQNALLLIAMREIVQYSV